MSSYLTVCSCKCIHLACSLVGPRIIKDHKISIKFEMELCFNSKMLLQHIIGGNGIGVKLGDGIQKLRTEELVDTK